MNAGAYCKRTCTSATERFIGCDGNACPNNGWFCDTCYGDDQPGPTSVLCPICLANMKQTANHKIDELRAAVKVAEDRLASIYVEMGKMTRAQQEERKHLKEKHTASIDLYVSTTNAKVVDAKTALAKKELAYELVHNELIEDNKVHPLYSVHESILSSS